MTHHHDITPAMIVGVILLAGCVEWLAECIASLF